jgi:hypothetical protein
MKKKILRAHAQIWREPSFWLWWKDTVKTFDRLSELREFAKLKGRKLKLSIEYLKEEY